MTKDASAMFAIFAHLDSTVKAIRALKSAGFTSFQVFSPVPRHELEHELASKASPVRIFTLVGGLVGLATGWAITLGPLPNFDLIVGGKPLASLPPFGVVAYICTILFGALATVVGLIVQARLPQTGLVEGYDPRLSSDHFGIRLVCSRGDEKKVRSLLMESGATDVKVNEQ